MGRISMTWIPCGSYSSAMVRRYCCASNGMCCRGTTFSPCFLLPSGMLGARGPSLSLSFSAAAYRTSCRGLMSNSAFSSAPWSSSSSAPAASTRPGVEAPLDETISAATMEGNEGQAGPHALAVETPEDWARRQAETAVGKERQSRASATYFQRMLEDVPELKDCLREAQRLMDGNSPDQLTRYQQSQLADRLSMYTAGIASERLMQTRREESAAKRFTQDGTPTGENYWMEAGNILASPAVPSLVKDEVLNDLQKEREPTSPAFMEPSSEQFTPLRDSQYADHVRRQKRRLLDGSDTLF